MDTLNQALHKALLNAPYEAFANIVVEKLARQGVALPPESVGALLNT
jgi:hypothetical protein